MSFLDRLRLQPRWKNADPAVRAAAVADFPDDPEHQQILAELAGDEDVRVRRAATARLRSVSELVARAGRETDDELRRELGERLVSIASAPSDGDGDAALALAGLSDQKHLAAVAKASPHDTVRTAALGRVHDPRILGAIARHATDAQIALEAANRIADAAELANIALKTDHKDAGIAALERAAEAAASEADQRELLESAASKAKSKGVAKRARAMIQTIEAAAAARRAAMEAWQQRIA